MEEHEQAALKRLIDIAMRDTGQSRVAASFLLAWWNAEECGGFDLTDLWRVDTAIAEDMVTYTSKKTNAITRVWEIKVKSILKLDRAEQAAAEEQDFDETEEYATADAAA